MEDWFICSRDSGILLNVGFRHETNIGPYVVCLANGAGRHIDNGFQPLMWLVLDVFGVTLDNTTNTVLWGTGDVLCHYDQLQEWWCHLFTSSNSEFCQWVPVRSRLHVHVRTSCAQGPSEVAERGSQARLLGLGGPWIAWMVVLEFCYVVWNRIVWYTDQKLASSFLSKESILEVL